jgi:hypothetical protein
MILMADNIHSIGYLQRGPLLYLNTYRDLAYLGALFFSSWKSGNIRIFSSDDKNLNLEQNLPTYLAHDHLCAGSGVPPNRSRLAVSKQGVRAPCKVSETTKYCEMLRICSRG